MALKELPPGWSRAMVEAESGNRYLRYVGPDGQTTTSVQLDM